MSEKKKLVVLSGAGISAESGIPTFRASDGLWEGHDVMEVATPEGWHKNPSLVLKFYNDRRKGVIAAQPNEGHLILVALEQFFDVVVVTQNVDDLHERAGSSNIVHLHGEIRKSRSTKFPDLVYDIEGWELKLGDKCERGTQLRPHIVWFGEAVPLIEDAADHVMGADVFIVIGTSLQVYPAAGLVGYVPKGAPIYVIDPNLPFITPRPNMHLLGMPGSAGMKKVYEELVGQPYLPS